jgi:hypothetical protein
LEKISKKVLKDDYRHRVQILAGNPVNQIFIYKEVKAPKKLAPTFPYSRILASNVLN